MYRIFAIDNAGKKPQYNIMDCGFYHEIRSNIFLAIANKDLLKSLTKVSKAQ
mgnify:CR=1 FL=1